jgi:hypothetical protein
MIMTQVFNNSTQQTDDCDREVTSGSWATETEAARDLDERLNTIGCFRVFKEVRGYYVQPRVGCDDEQPRIDRILIPEKSLVEKGWMLGAVGIECKVSGKKLGPVVSQCMDYSRAVFTLPTNQIRICVSWVFIWSTLSIKGNLASLMAQNCVGEARGGSYELFRLGTAGGHILEVMTDGYISVRNPACGRKVGSR